MEIASRVSTLTSTAGSLTITFSPPRQLFGGRVNNSSGTQISKRSSARYLPWKNASSANESATRRIAGHGLRPGTDLEFFVDAANVGVDGGKADADFVANFLVEQALGEQLKDFAFARGKVLGFGRVGRVRGGVLRFG